MGFKVAEMKRIGWVFTLLLLLASVSCTEKGKPIRVNEPDTRSEPAVKMNDLNMISPSGEALAWEKLGAFDHATLLRLWTETTAQAIFPGRKIGRLAPGYEASLLVLGQNPLADFSVAVRDIRWRMKQGELLTVPAPVK